MTATEIQYAAKDIATRLIADMKAGRIRVGSVDVVNGAVAGFLVGNAQILTTRDIDDFERLTLRAFVEGCA